MSGDRFKVGDRVIIGAGHPHAGKSGRISEPFSSPSVPDLKWRVELDDWCSAAVSEREIVPSPRRARRSVASNLRLRHL